MAGTAQCEARGCTGASVAVSAFLLMGIDVQPESDFDNGRYIQTLGSFLIQSSVHIFCWINHSKEPSYLDLWLANLANYRWVSCADRWVIQDAFSHIQKAKFDNNNSILIVEIILIFVGMFLT